MQSLKLYELKIEQLEKENKDLKQQLEKQELIKEGYKEEISKWNKKYKDLKRENLRDHMTDLELIFSMLGERATTEITQTKNSQGFNELKTDSYEGGKIAGNARKELEAKTGRKVTSQENYLPHDKVKNISSDSKGD